MPSADLLIDDPRVSEAHALVSLRGDALFLLALRGRLRVGGRRVPLLRLDAGLRVELAQDIDVEVVDRCLPDHILGLDVPGQRMVPLVRSVYTLVEGPPVGIAPGFDPRGTAWIWMANGVRFRQGAGAPQALHAGDRIPIGETTLQVRRIALCEGAADNTVDSARRGPALEIRARFETLHIHREDGAFFTIGGIPARIVSELADYDVPVSWSMLARQIWPDARRDEVLRANWDRHLKRLRQRLRAAGFRSDLVRADGRGNVELFLMPGDTVVNEG